MDPCTGAVAPPVQPGVVTEETTCQPFAVAAPVTGFTPKVHGCPGDDPGTSRGAAGRSSAITMATTSATIAVPPMASPAPRRLLDRIASSEPCRRTSVAGGLESLLSGPEPSSGDSTIVPPNLKRTT